MFIEKIGVHINQFPLYLTISTIDYTQFIILHASCTARPVMHRIIFCSDYSAIGRRDIEKCLKFSIVCDSIIPSKYHSVYCEIL